MKKSTNGTPRILARRLATQLSRKALTGAASGASFGVDRPTPIGGIETQTLVYPPDKDTLSGGTPV
ncbi:MAG: hypothetical protein M3O15_04220 [Acidobacteriota bacterium]|nr:hypothetical protein [Acidobacteriota bacterium]